MTKLISNYARVTGLQIDPNGPNVKEVFFPLPFEKYITIQTGSGQHAKCYDLWPEILEVIRPILEANKIAIVHLGAREDPQLAGVYDARGRTSFFQANYVIKRSMLHLGNDSWLAHCAGWNKRPLVALYGSTSSWNHGPYWADWDKTVLIDSHRWGGVPTYANENPKCVNLIDPFRVANEALRLLGINHKVNREARFWGLLYQHTLLDLIPNSVPSADFLPQLPITVRMDYFHNDDVLLALLRTGRKVNIVTRKQINPAIIAAHKNQILTYNHEIAGEGTELADRPTPEYIGTIKGLCPRSIWFTRKKDPEEVALIRTPYFPDLCMVEQVKDVNKEDYLVGALHYQNKEDTPENRLALEAELGQTKFRTTKFLLSDGLVFLSRAHQLENKPVKSLNDNIDLIIDSPIFFKDLNHFSLWYEPTNSPSNPA